MSCTSGRTRARSHHNSISHARLIRRGILHLSCCDVFQNNTRETDLAQQVVEIQKRKKKLAEVTFGSGQLSEDGIGVNTLLASRISYILAT